jgi:sugar phosphate isomerase/epimerase
MSRRHFLEQSSLSLAAAGMASLTSVALRADPLGLPIGSQTYPERQMVADGKFVDLLKNFVSAGVRQIELCSPGYAQFKSLADGKQTRTIIEDHGLTCPSSHFTMNELRNAQGQAIEWAHAVGMTQMGTASLGGRVVGGVTNVDEIKRAADEYNKIAVEARKAGLQQFLHNEGFENSKLNDGRLTYPVLLEHLDPDLVKMQFQMSSMPIIGDPIMYFTLYPGRFISAHLHGVDLEGPRPPAREMSLPIKQPAGAGARGRGAAAPAAPGIAIGDDSVDWPRVFAAAKIGGMKNYFIEQEQPGGGWDLMAKGAAYLKTLTV